jgi:hypothetical protein
MRTGRCELIARRRCLDVYPIILLLADNGVISHDLGKGGLDAFAKRDGFSSWAGLKAFWRRHHPGVDEFVGVLITWETPDG